MFSLPKTTPWLSVVSLSLLLAWTLPDQTNAQTTSGTPAPVSAHRAAILRKLNSITVSVNFDKTDIATVIDFLTKKSKELDPDKEGINFVLRLPDAPAKTHREISIILDNISLNDLLKEISQQTNLQCSVEDYAVVLHPLN